MSKPNILLLVPILAASLPSFCGDDWRREAFTSPADQVFQAAKEVVSQHYGLKSSDDSKRTLRFHIGTTAWSWGYNVSLNVEPTGINTSVAWVAIEKSGGPVFSWGSGKKEVGKVWRWTHENLYKGSKREGKDR